MMIIRSFETILTNHIMLKYSNNYAVFLFFFIFADKYIYLSNCYDKL